MIRGEEKRGGGQKGTGKEKAGRILNVGGSRRKHNVLPPKKCKGWEPTKTVQELRLTSTGSQKFTTPVPSGHYCKMRCKETIVSSEPWSPNFKW